MAVFLFAGLLSGGREFFLLFFIMLFVIIYSLVLNLWTAFSFSFIQELSDQSVVKGSLAHLKIGIYNDKPFPFTLMKVYVETVTPDGTYELSFNLSPQSHIDYLIPISCPYRGVYGVGMTKIETNDIFGLVKTRFDMRNLPYYRHQLIKILPRIMELPYLPARGADAKYSGGAAKRISEEGDSYSDLRRYHPGDPLKKVHKPVSARKRELYVKSYDIPLETTVLVAIDTGMESGEGETGRYLADLACECAVAIAEVSFRSGFNVELAGVDLSRSFKRKRNQEVLSALCDTLAELKFDRDGDLSNTLDIAASKTGMYRAAYIISSAPPSSYAGALLRLQRDGCHVCFTKISGEKSRTESRSESGNTLKGVSCIHVTLGDDVRSALTEDSRYGGSG